ncbi:acyl-CoA dehydrogenase family protein [Flavihumibacter rivuli]|uniref:acyl-CoA dehydrogenase family protein n=1 Tax=Flavihumibacter rivuli TaxID=2838156 RepID=UPI001BDE048F|nr:acyl-CoA dehydrogenase family protein [Flavihumibacter rivuli]ULQ55937.1 acyl-CoA dehydrogenase family protein [Flavihumibacter rivuli]
MGQSLALEQVIPAAIMERIRRYSASAEQMRQLHPEQVAILHQEGWLRMMVPKAYGGLELGFPEVIRLEEALAWVDGSIGWTVTLCSGANWFIGFLPDETAKEFFGDSHVCLAGSGAPTGTAQITGNGYIINGRWKYATGSPIATAFTANCLLEKDGQPILDANGQQAIRAFVFKQEEVIINDDWSTIGMIATASNSYEVEELEVPETRSFVITPDAARLDGLIFRVPFLPFATATLTANLSGMAIRFLELAGQLNEERLAKGQVDEAFGRMVKGSISESNRQITALRKLWYDLIEDYWKFGNTFGIFQEELSDLLAISSRGLANSSRHYVDEIYPLLGLAAANTATEINRVWRNLHTASQHALFASIQDHDQAQ